MTSPIKIEPSKRKKRCRHVWEYSENCWKRNICTKCLKFQKEKNNIITVKEKV